MSKNKKWAKKDEEAENQFNRLPDDVILNIFNKLSDMKWLCRCFVVWKRFASLIPLVQTLSIKTNACDYPSLPSFTSFIPQERSSFVPKGMFSFIEYFVIKPLRAPSFIIDVYRHVFLAKLKQIRSLNLDIVSDFKGNDDSVFKWGAEFTSKIDSVTFLYAASLSKMMESEEEEEENENELSLEELLRRLYLAFNCLKEAMLWLGIVSHVIAKYPMLRSISITDSMNKGVRKYLGGEKLGECMNESVVSYVKRWNRDITRVGYVPVLQLPISGYVMKRVTIVHISN